MNIEEKQFSKDFSFQMFFISQQRNSMFQVKNIPTGIQKYMQSTWFSELTVKFEGWTKSLSRENSWNQFFTNSIVNLNLK